MHIRSGLDYEDSELNGGNSLETSGVSQPPDANEGMESHKKQHTSPVSVHSKKQVLPRDSESDSVSMLLSDAKHANEGLQAFERQLVSEEL